MTLWTLHLFRARVQLALNWTISMFYQRLKTERKKKTKSLNLFFFLKNKWTYENWNWQDFTWWIMHQIGRIKPQHPPCTVAVLMEKNENKWVNFRHFSFDTGILWNDGVRRYLDVTKPSQDFIVDLLVRFSRWYRMCFNFRDMWYNAARHTRYIPAIVRRSILNHMIACVMCCAEQEW